MTTRFHSRLLSELGIESWQPAVEVDGKPQRVVLEGGSIDVNGAGTAAHHRRVPAQPMSSSAIPGSRGTIWKQVFARLPGHRQSLWLDRGIAGDDTHGHVDDIARFVDRHDHGDVVEDRSRPTNYEPLRENLDACSGTTTRMASPCGSSKLPMPAPVCFEGQRLPASYANFYIANKRRAGPRLQRPPTTARAEHAGSSFSLRAASFRSIAAISSGAWAPSTA